MKSKVLNLVVALTLAISLVPIASHSARADGGELRQISIDELLAAGNYAEGEAIVLVRSSGDLDITSDIETLAEVDGNAVSLAAKEAEETQSTVDDEALVRIESIQKDAYSVKHIVDPSRTTEQILRDLYDDPDVIAAEPNYLVDAAAAFGNKANLANEEEAQEQPGATTVDKSKSADKNSALQQQPNSVVDIKAESTTEMATEQQLDSSTAPNALDLNGLSPSANNVSNSGDLTDQQWYLSESTANYTTPRAPTSTYNINVPGWREGRSDQNAPDNASGTVCIMDTGIDVTHPDIKEAMYTFSAAQQAKYGCGPYGMNASGSGEPGDVTDYGEHGTHVAGIVASQWNGIGSSGIAKGVKVFPVRIFDPKGSVSQAATVKGFKFLIDAAQDINLKAVNCSWGTIRAQFILTVMVNELGAKGVNTVFASGNRALDLDENIDSGGQTNSPYAITVNAAQPDGALTDFSCWGQTSTDVFAPGAEILSTVPPTLTAEGAYTNNTRFYPEATAQENLTYGIDHFGTGMSDVRFFDKNPSIDSDAKEIGSHTNDVGFDDKGAMAFKVRSLAKSESYLGGYLKAEIGSVYMAIPVNSVTDSEWLALRFADNDANKFTGGIASITCAKKDDGSPVQVDNYCVSILNKGIAAASNGAVYWSQWIPSSLDVAGYVSASNEAHAKYLQDPTSLDFQTEDVTLHYKDPGEVTGLYGWSNGGKTYVIVEVGLGQPEINTINDDTTLYIDNVAVGNGNVFADAFEVMAGTSMATPCVTGCLTVIAKDEPQSSALSSEQLELEARERSAKLLASVEYDDSLAKLCRTGGRVNLNGQSTFDTKAPLVTQAICRDDELRISGYFFGASGTLYVDDVQTASTSWSDESITAPVSTLENGTHVAKVVNADGAVMRVLFSYSNISKSGRPLYERDHSLPLSLEEYAAKETDRLHGAMAACNGKLYALAASSEDNLTQGMWSYDIASDKWASVELPEGYARQEANPGCLAATNDKVYLIGSAESDDSGEPRMTLWEYDTSTNAWTRVQLDGLESYGCICALGDNLFLIDEFKMPKSGNTSGSGTNSAYALGPQAEATGADNDGDAQERTFFRLIDAQKGTLTPVKGDIPSLTHTEDGEPTYSILRSRVVSSSNKMYVFVSSNKGKTKSTDVETVTLARATYDAQAQSMNVEDITDAFEQAIGDKLASYVDSQTDESLNDYFALAGLSDGLAIVGSDEIGNDTHIIKDSSVSAESYDRTSCYHHATNPLAASWDGYLYATANNSTEPSVMYFRSTDYNHKQNNGNQPNDAPESRKDETPNTPNGDNTNASTRSALPHTADFQSATIGRSVVAFALAGLAAMALALRLRGKRAAKESTRR